MKVEPVEADDDYTFCAVVPRKHEFTLGGGVSVPNCGACEPECPVEAIFPEDALPEKWEPFIKINYAFADGFDAVNKLTNEYATEHNVQNPPLE
jgi:NAD-dependent dihydropyrimidine dehydrogenase PreA subunit